MYILRDQSEMQFKFSIKKNMPTMRMTINHQSEIDDRSQKKRDETKMHDVGEAKIRGRNNNINTPG